VKLCIQAQYMQIGDIVGSGEKVVDIVRASIHFSSSKIMVTLNNGVRNRTSYWNKYITISVDREDLPKANNASHYS